MDMEIEDEPPLDFHIRTLVSRMDKVEAELAALTERLEKAPIVDLSCMHRATWPDWKCLFVNSRCKLDEHQEFVPGRTYRVRIVVDEQEGISNPPEIPDSSGGK